MKSSRRRSRELAVQALYAWQLGGARFEELAAHAAESSDFDKADETFFRTLLSGVLREAETLRAAIGPQLDRKWEQLSPVERGILMLAAYELQFVPEVPLRVAINEAVEIAKSFGGTDGFKYVNGVLDRLGKALRPREVRP
jgi:transcription antitermination protein NusB